MAVAGAADAKSDVPSEMLVVEFVIWKNSTLETPPPGAGFDTVTEAVPAAALSEVVMAAFSCESVTNVVARALPFQSTTEPDTKPVPLTVSVNPDPPGDTAAGTSGWLIRGTGFV
jgi:hypothetical protein